MILKNSGTKTLICPVRILTFCRNCTGLLQFIFNAMEEFSKYSKLAVFSCLKCTFAFGFRNPKGVFAQLYIVLVRQNINFFVHPIKQKFIPMSSITSNFVKCVYFISCVRSHIHGNARTAEVLFQLV